jgi:hypothetical protein
MNKHNIFEEEDFIKIKDIKKDGKKFVINNTERGYSIEPFINTGEYILDYHNNLYLLDINKANISMLLKGWIFMCSICRKQALSISCARIFMRCWKK